MMNLFSRNAIVGFSSLFLLSLYGIFAVSGGDDWGWGYSQSSNFTPETFVDKSYEPLFYSGNIFYGENWFDNGHMSRFNELMVKEWNNYIGASMSTKDIEYFIIKDSSYNDMVAINKAIKSKKEIVKWKSNFNINDKKVTDFFQFLNLAKFVETYSSFSPSWDYDANTNDNSPKLNDVQIKKIEKYYYDCKEPFLKNRYWFQAMKANFYSYDKNLATLFFNKTQAEIPRNTLYYRGLSYIAGVLYKNKEYTKSNFLYSIVFDNCPELRIVTAYCFHPQEQKDFDLSLEMAKTEKQKAALWALYGYYADEKVAIEKMYALDPKSEHLEFMLTRLINKEEDKLNALPFENIAEYRKAVKEKLNNETYALVSKIAQNKNTLKPYLWAIAAGYLEIFKANYKVASTYFKEAENTMPKTELALGQLRILRLINYVTPLDKIDSKVEKELLPELQWLYGFSNENKLNAVLRTSNVTSWSKLIISNIYKSQKQLVMSELFDRNYDFYLTSSKLEEMKSFLQKTKKTPWETLALSVYNVNLDDINTFQAQLATYKDDIDAAVSFMQKTNTTQGIVLYGNPFNGKVQDCHDCDHAAPQKVKYTELDFLKKMQEMKQSIEQGNDVFNNSLLLGNAFYNISYYGNARLFYNGNIIRQYGNDIDKLYQELLTGDKIAEMYYKKALTAATDNEQKAKCTFLLSKIERNKFYQTAAFEADKTDFIAFPGFKKLKSDYSDTQYYQQAINECGYFSKYLGM